MKVFHNIYPSVVSLENLFDSWREFKKGKRGKLDVQIFERNLENNLFKLHHEFKNKTYKHSNYTSFYITDPKARFINKALVRDRIVHHAVYRVLYSVFDETFIFDSYSCRSDKGTHRAIYRFEKFVRAVSKNYSGPCFVLKCDIKKFFASVNHDILINLIEKKVKDEDMLRLVGMIIDSFGDTRPLRNDTQMSFDILSPIGMPIGNLTSQLFANIYLNELDQFVKNKLMIKYYIRYCDDFVFLSTDPNALKLIRSKVESYLRNTLKLELHPQKVSIEKISSGIDFLGYVILPHYRLLRTKTKKRMLKKVCRKNLPSYHGLLNHCNGYKLEQKIRMIVDNKYSKTE